MRFFFIIIYISFGFLISHPRTNDGMSVGGINNNISITMTFDSLYSCKSLVSIRSVLLLADYLLCSLLCKGGVPGGVVVGELV